MGRSSFIKMALNSHHFNRGALIEVDLYTLTDDICPNPELQPPNLPTQAQKPLTQSQNRVALHSCRQE